MEEGDMKGLRPQEGRGRNWRNSRLTRRLYTPRRWWSTPRARGRRQMGPVTREPCGRRQAAGWAAAVCASSPRRLRATGYQVGLSVVLSYSWALARILNGPIHTMGLICIGPASGGRAGGLEMRVASAARAGLEAGVGFGSDRRSAEGGPRPGAPPRRRGPRRRTAFPARGVGRFRHAAPQS